MPARVFASSHVVFGSFADLWTVEQIRKQQKAQQAAQPWLARSDSASSSPASSPASSRPPSTICSLLDDEFERRRYGSATVSARSEW
jgi:hypothetical protein